MNRVPIEKRYHALVASLGCHVCMAPANIHHIREGQGMGQRAGHFLVVPLCQEHHQGDFSIHANKKQFENIYGSELDMLNDTIRKVFAHLESND